MRPEVGLPSNAHPPSHPLADLLPLIYGAEFDALVADIRDHGLRVPITLFNGMVLDGRNRLAACKVAGVDPRFEVFTGTEDDALAYVLSLNVARRHLTTCQRAVLALKLLPLEEDRARRRQGTRTDLHQDSDGGDGQALDQAGARVSVSRDTVWKAKRISKHSPDVIDAITEGVVRSMPEAQRLGGIPNALRPAVVEHLRQHGGKVYDALRAVRADEQEQRAEQPPTPVVVEEPGVSLLYGLHVIDALRHLEAASVHCVITSPPYWSGLRDYGAPPVVWGDRLDDDDDDVVVVGECEHDWGEAGPPHHRGQVEQTRHPRATGTGAGQNGSSGTFCARCGAWRGHLGHEATVGLYVAHLVAVFNEIRRVLRPDGTAWLVIGDCYAGPRPTDPTLKPKDLVMVPHRVALALQDAGWWIRQDIVFDKINALPESVTDRPTRAHEYVFMLAHPDGAGAYYYDQDAIREEFTDQRPKVDRRGRQRWTGGREDGHTRPHGIDPRPHKKGRNKRSVWTLPTQPGSGHLAACPEALIEPCLAAGTSAAGACAACGAPWSRDAEADGWRPSCACGVDEVAPCVVLDPFSGSATTGKVARDHGRSYVGIDLQVDYLALAKQRIGISGDGE